MGIHWGDDYEMIKRLIITYSKINTTKSTHFTEDQRKISNCAAWESQ